MPPGANPIRSDPKRCRAGTRRSTREGKGNSNRMKQRCRRGPLTLAGSIMFLSLSAAAAVAAERSTGGAGAIGAPPAPVAEDVRCVSRCLDVRKVTGGGSAVVTGRNLGQVREVRMGGTSIDPSQTRARSVRFQVPSKVKSSKPLLIDTYGARSRAPAKLVVEDAEQTEGVSAFEVRRVDVVNRKSFFKSQKQSLVEYTFEAAGPTDIRIDVLKGKQQKLIDTIVQRDREPFEAHKARWRGLSDKRKVAPNGKYRFRVSEVNGSSGPADRFRFYNHIFPLRGKHSYGQSLGAGRGHQGQDLLAGCGNRVVAARGGRVTNRSYQSAAGYYVVIDGAKTGVDYTYMHLKRGGRPKVGQRVKTGELIGRSSDSGNASTCMLHFELWSAPGWYAGGSPMNPTPILRRWDRWS